MTATVEAPDQSEVLTIEAALHEALGLTANQRLVSYDPLLRHHYDFADRSLGTGALVIRCSIMDESGGNRRSGEADLVIDDNRRPLSEDHITMLGAIAESNRNSGRILRMQIRT